MEQSSSKQLRARQVRISDQVAQKAAIKAFCEEKQTNAPRDPEAQLRLKSKQINELQAMLSSMKHLVSGGNHAAHINLKPTVKALRHELAGAR